MQNLVKIHSELFLYYSDQLGKSTDVKTDINYSKYNLKLKTNLYFKFPFHKYSNLHKHSLDDRWSSQDIQDIQNLLELGLENEIFCSF